MPKRCQKSKNIILFNQQKLLPKLYTRVRFPPPAPIEALRDVRAPPTRVEDRRIRLEGVPQTARNCAPAFLRARAPGGRPHPAGYEQDLARAVFTDLPLDQAAGFRARGRSEERRVGKE